MTLELDALGRDSSWEGVRALVTGFGVSGFAAADTLTHLGAAVVAVDESDDEPLQEKAKLLGILGADVRLGQGSTDITAEGFDLVVRFDVVDDADADLSHLFPEGAS